MKSILAAALLASGVAASAQQAPPPPTAAGVAAPAPASGRPPPAPKPQTVSSRPGASGGEALYLAHCAMCHGPSGMGTGLLGRRVQPAQLEARKGLPASYIITAARRGIGNMPPVPRGEVGDADLKAIADYLAAGPHGAAR